MSDFPQSVGHTLTAGIQDISAILPLIGTEQCENHVGSALEGGFLYAAAAPLSIFGSLGIVKAGISILITTLSVDISVFFRKQPTKPRWLAGARALQNTGIKLPGTVAPLIAMDGTRYKAETRLIQILAEKHINNPENISISWKSQQWNILLILSIIIAAIMSVTPYIALLLGSSSWRPSTHTPWIFPLLRTVGSCLATVCCQFLIQSRVISLMKARILFMTIHRRLADDLSNDNQAVLSRWLRENLHWDAELPAEQCLWSLENFLTSGGQILGQNVNLEHPPGHVSVPMEKSLFDKQIKFDYPAMQALIIKHFPTTTLDHIFTLISGIILCLSLPATVAGYIGCFTLVNASHGNGPLIWVGIEAALSLIRITIWAWNPRFDEETNITMKLTLIDHQPLVTTEEYNPFIYDVNSEQRKPLVLVPERKFLEWITPYTGPFNPFLDSEHLALYFTLSADFEEKPHARKTMSLLMTVFDFNKRIAVTLSQVGGGLRYFDAAVKYNPISAGMEAELNLAINTSHSWLTHDGVLFHALVEYFNSIKRALNRPRLQNHVYERNGLTQPVPEMANLQWKWTLLTQRKKNILELIPNQEISPLGLTVHDLLYLDRGYEHQLKTDLISKWDRWIVEGMGEIQSDARNDCYASLMDGTSKRAKWELTKLDWTLGWEWTRRELSLVVMSITLEDILRARMETCISKVCNERENPRLNNWMRSEFEIGRQKRLSNERIKMQRRMDKSMTKASECATKEGRLWSDQELFKPQWQSGYKLIDKQWEVGIEHGPKALGNAVAELDNLVEGRGLLFRPILGSPRVFIVNQVKRRLAHWDLQRENEWREMDGTVCRIRDSLDGLEHLNKAYKFPEPDSQAALRFVDLNRSTSKGMACSPNVIVYDVGDCKEDVICGALEKSITRSVINLPQKLINSICQNEHLLFVRSWREEKPAFIQRNRDQWWEQQTNNSSIFYFSPQGISDSSCYADTSSGPIAHVFLFINTASRVLLSLIHYGDPGVGSVSIHHSSKRLCRTSAGIPKRLQLQEFDLNEFQPGRYELQVIPSWDRENGYYYLRDILIEFST